MKKIITLLFCSLMFTFGLKAQQDQCKISLAVVPSKTVKELPLKVQNYLLNRLTNLVNSNGYIANVTPNRFVVTADLLIHDKTYLPGPPRMCVQTLDLTLLVGDKVTGEIYSTAIYSLKSTGKNETESFINAIKQIRGNSEQITDLFDSAELKIKNYYNKFYPNILKSASQNASIRNYEEALYELSTIPNCTDGYEKAFEMASKVYLSHINYEGRQNLSLAKTAWATEPDWNGAGIALEYFSKISPDADCMTEVEGLAKEIQDTLLRDIEFARELKKDSINFQKEMMLAEKEQEKEVMKHEAQLMKDANEIEKARLHAIVSQSYNKKNVSQLSDSLWQELADAYAKQHPSNFLWQ